VSYLNQELQAAIRSANKPLIICGAGVTRSATGGAAPGWSELIASGIERARQLGTGSLAWASYAEERLASSDMELWISVADEVTDKLGGDGGAEYAKWIEDCVSSLSISDTDLLSEIFALGCPVATTNYDHVLSSFSGRPPISWRDHVAVAKFLKGQAEGVLHLHGTWSDPASVILGRRSYQRLTTDKRYELVQSVFALTRPSILIGCSEQGISDPDFMKLEEFLKVWKSATERRYWLVQGDPSAFVQSSSNLVRRLLPVPYGTSHSQLSRFLSTLKDARSLPSTPVQSTGSIRSIEQRERRPDVFGRNPEVASVVSTLLRGGSATISGGPGFGKTTIAVAALYHPDVASQFEARRVLVALDETDDTRSMLVKIVEALGLTPSADSFSLLRQIETAAAIEEHAVVIDNAEVIFEADRAQSTKIVGLLNQMSGLSTVVISRSVITGIGADLTIDHLDKLRDGSDEEAFLAIAGPGFSRDPALRKLLDALDGHALSIILVAAQAAGLPRLQTLLEIWEESHAEMLRSSDEEEGRSTSVRASLSISLQSRAFVANPVAKRVLSLLAFVPAGIIESDAVKIVTSWGSVTRAKAYEAVQVLYRLRLIEQRLDGRVRMLNPLREAVKLDVRTPAKDRQILFRHFLRIAEKGDLLGTPRWTEVRAVFESEKDNLDQVCLEAARVSSDVHPLSNALHGLGNYAQFTGRATTTSIELAVRKFSRGDGLGVTSSLSYILGQVAQHYSDQIGARAHFEKSREYAISAGSDADLAQATFGLGSVALNLSDNVSAQAFFEDALRLAKRIGRIRTEAHATLGLGSIIIRSDRPETARPVLHGAENLYRREGNPQGLANALRYLALTENVHNREILLEALRLYTLVGDDYSVSTTLSYLGEERVQQGAFDEARDYLGQAIEVARSVGSLSAEASSRVRFGEIACIEGDRRAGVAEVVEALDIYNALLPDEDRAKPGWVLLRDALTADSSDASMSLEVKARQSWEQVGRFDLIRGYLRLPEYSREPDGDDTV
jgi:tetratricopeptide (TPR) repeat protein